MKTNVTISTLKKLLQTNKNRINVYNVAYKNTQYKDLKRNFLINIATSKKYKLEIKQIIKDLGGSATTHYTFKGYLFIIIMKLNMVISNYGRKTILNFCSYWEYTVKKGYLFALNKKNINNLSIPNQKIMKDQQKQITLERSDISILRKMSV